VSKALNFARNVPQQNPVGADFREILVGMQGVLAAAQPERYAAAVLPSFLQGIQTTARSP
jgi:hypothetical protein